MKHLMLLCGLLFIFCSCNKTFYGNTHEDLGLTCPVSDFKFKNVGSETAYVFVSDHATKRDGVYQRAGRDYYEVEPGEKIKVKLNITETHVCINQLCSTVKIVPCQEYDFSASSFIPFDKDKLNKAVENLTGNPLYYEEEQIPDRTIPIEEIQAKPSK